MKMNVEQLVLEHLSEVEVPANQIIDLVVDNIDPEVLVAMLALHYPDYISDLRRLLVKS